ncbi:MAG: hypothetical protein KDD68_19770, partial [Bdellovibrionales bacterium]|nr:hypothetical protein [Bdellovibrionales bacterium]
LGLKYIFKDVTKFPTINQEAGVILRQTLPNGVTRLQFPREAFSRMGWTAKTDNISRMKYFGFKSIFPESAGLTVLNKVSDSVVGASTSGRRHAYSYIRGIRVKVTLNSDLQIVTAFPD